MKVYITREEDTGIETIGSLVVADDYGDIHFECATLELPWNENKRNISCIPIGEYQVTPYSSVKYPNTFEVLGVPGRAYILMHWGNYYFNTEGCILLGRNVMDINGDGEYDITHSKDTFSDFRKVLGDQDFELSIVENFKI